MPMELQGADDLRDDLTNMAANLEFGAGVNRALEAGAEPIEQQMLANASSDPKIITGALHDSIHTGKVKKRRMGGKAITIGVHHAEKGAYYANPVEHVRPDPVGTDWSAIVTHEIGHAIDGYISQRMRGTDSSYANWDFNSTEMRSKIAARLGVPTSSASISREVSRYGGTKSVEWFAESFAEGMRSANPRRMAKEFMKDLDEILRRLR